MAKHGRRDRNHRAIREGLRQVGADVVDLGDVGDSVPDLMVGFRGRTYLLEIKSEGGRLSPGQSAFLERWRGGPAVVVWSLEDALRAIGAMG